MENSINLGLCEILQTKPEYDFEKKMGVEPLAFITDQMEGIIVPRNTEFMAIRCFKSNCRIYVTHPCV
jgi:hypothetical protein